MILTHGINSLKRGGGGSPGVWTLDIPHLELTDHTDADGIRYTFINITKINDGQALRGDGNFDLTVKGFENFGRIKKVTATGKLIVGTGNNFFGYGGADVSTSNYWYGGSLGTWLRRVINDSRYDWLIRVDNGSGNRSSDYDIYRWNGRRLYGISNPSILEYELDYDIDGRDYMYINGTLIADRVHYYGATYVEGGGEEFNTDSGGVNYSGSVELYSLNVYYEKD